MHLDYVSILQKNKDRWIIYIPARYTKSGDPDRIGVDYLTNLPFDSKNYAARIALKLEDDIRMKGFVDTTLYKYQKPAKYIMEHFVETWLKDKAALAPETLRQYRYKMVAILAFWGKKDLRQITLYETREYRQSLKGKPSSKNTIIGIVNDIFARANEWHHLEVPLIEKYKAVKKMKVSVDEGTRRLILSRIPKYHQPIFRFIFNTGCRPSEAMKLLLPLINWEEKITYIKETKERKEKGIRFDLFEDLTPMLREIYDNAKDKEGPVFLNRQGRKYVPPTLHWILRQATEGMTDFTITHLGRSTVITLMLGKYDLLDTMAQVGHKRISTTQEYIQAREARGIKPKLIKGKKEKKVKGE